MNVINDVKSFLSQNFGMKDLWQANVILNTKIIRESYKIIMSKSYYVEQLLKKFKYFDYKPVCSPYDSSVHLKKI